MKQIVERFIVGWIVGGIGAVVLIIALIAIFAFFKNPPQILIGGLFGVWFFSVVVTLSVHEDISKRK